MNYGTKLKELRINNNLTQEKLSKDLGIARITYSHYEVQEKIIPVDRLNTVSNYYDVSLDYIFELTNKKQYHNIKNKEIDRKKVALRIKEFRKENGLTQIKLANILNIANGTIAEYERGTNIIATPFLYTICKKYNISADYLLGKTDNPKYLK